MCDLRTFNRIEKAVERRMAAGQMFTAFDITLALQKKGVRSLHGEIRRDIKRVADELMWRFGYERTLTRFVDLGAEAFVYHPYGTDAGSHRPSIRPRALAPAKRKRRSHTAIAAMRADANQNQRDFQRLPDEVARMFDLTLKGEAETDPGIVSGFFIVIKHRDPRIN